MARASLTMHQQKLISALDALRDRLDDAVRRNDKPLCREISADIISVCRELDTTARQADVGDNAGK